MTGSPFNFIFLINSSDDPVSLKFRAPCDGYFHDVFQQLFLVTSLTEPLQIYFGKIKGLSDFGLPTSESFNMSPNYKKSGYTFWFDDEVRGQHELTGKSIVHKFDKKRMYLKKGETYVFILKGGGASEKAYILQAMFVPKIGAEVTYIRSFGDITDGWENIADGAKITNGLRVLWDTYITEIEVDVAITGDSSTGSLEKFIIEAFSSNYLDTTMATMVGEGEVWNKAPPNEDTKTEGSLTSFKMNAAASELIALKHYDKPNQFLKAGSLVGFVKDLIAGSSIDTLALEIRLKGRIADTWNNRNKKSGFFYDSTNGINLNKLEKGQIA